MTHTYRHLQRALSAQARAGSALICADSIGDVDTARGATELMTVHTAYRAALRTVASIRQQSLLDFLE
jgi:flagellin-like hook-associated protein FlgL